MCGEKENVLKIRDNLFEGLFIDCSKIETLFSRENEKKNINKTKLIHNASISDSNWASSPSNTTD